MNPQLKSLLWGILIGGFIALIIICHLSKKPGAPPVDLKPYYDTIEHERRERRMAEARVIYWLNRADSAERLLVKSKKKRDADIKIIEALTPGLLARWHDSTMRANGYR